MKQYWQKIVFKIDALTLRERGIIFVMIAVIVLTIVNSTFLDPLFASQKQLSTQVQSQQEQIGRIQDEIRSMVKVQNDPDQANRERLQALRQQFTQMQSVLVAMQKGLVTPDKMTVLLEDILRQDGRLRLVSLKTLPPTVLADQVAQDSAPAPDKGTVSALKPPPAATGMEPPVTGAVYKHGVEIVVQGAYLDMLNYMAALEAMPWQLFWGKARLNVDEYPKATLTLTLFTLSLDKKWLNL